MNLLLVEIQRALRRRAVRVLVLLALAGCALAAVVSLVGSSGKSIVELHANGDMHPAVMRDWWVPERSDGALMISAVLLLLGGLFGGASVAGAEWRYGTIATSLTWEPRRVRFHLARTAACGILAFAISFVLQAVFLAAFVPSVFSNGTTSGTGLDWWIALVGAMSRISLLTALAAVLGVAIATIGRNTAAALIVVFAWMAVIEGLLRSIWPGTAPYLWGENIGTVLPWSQMDTVDFERGPLVALGTLAVYSAVIVVASTYTFGRRDVATAI